MIKQTFSDMIRQSWSYQKGIATILILIALLIVIIAGGIAGGIYFSYLKPHPYEQSAHVMPPNTDFYFSMNLRPGKDQLMEFKDLYDRFNKIHEFKDEIEEAMNNMEEDTGINPKDDILPWLTEVGIGIVDFAQIDEEPKIVAVANTKDRAATEDIIDKLVDYIENKNTNLFSNEYRGYEYYTDDEYLYFTVTNDYFTLCTNEDLLKEVVDLTLDGGPSLYDQEKFQAARKNVPNERFSLTYVDMESIYDGLEKREKTEFSDVIINTDWEKAKQTTPSTMVISGAFIDQGIRFDYYADIQGKEMILLGPNSLTSTTMLPVNTFYFASLTNMARIWDEFRTSIEDTYDESGENLEWEFNQIEEWLQEKTDITFGEIFDWMTGEIALAVMPSENITERYDNDETIPLNLVVTFETDDISKAESLMNKVNKAVQNQTDYEFIEKTINGKKVYVIEDQSLGNYTPCYMFLNNNLIIGSSTDTLSQMIDISEGRGDALSENIIFKRTLALTEDETFVFFLNAQELINTIVELMSPDVASEFEWKYSQYTDPFEAMYASGSLTKNAITATFLITFTEAAKKDNAVIDKDGSLEIINPEVDVTGFTIFDPEDKISNADATKDYYVYLETGEEGVRMQGPAIEGSQLFNLEDAAITGATSFSQSSSPNATPGPKKLQHNLLSDEQTIQTAIATFYGDVHKGPDTTTNTWCNEDGLPGHWFPTANGLASSITTDSSLTDGDYNAQLLYIDVDKNGEFTYGEEVTDSDISSAAIWMGLLVNEAREGSSIGCKNRSTAAPQTNEDSMYLIEFPKSSNHEYNGNPAIPGGMYTWIVGKNGRVYSAYKATNGNWYKGFNGSLYKGDYVDTGYNNSVNNQIIGYKVKVNPSLEYNIELGDYDNEVSLAKVDLGLNGDIITPAFTFIAIKSGSIPYVKITAVVDGNTISREYARPIEILSPKVWFNDDNLEQVIREVIDKPHGDIHQANLLYIYDLDASNKDITDLTGIEFCTNLEWLFLEQNKITNLEPIAKLVNLERLHLWRNNIEDVSYLSNLNHIWQLNLWGNQIEDISPIVALENLMIVNLNDNLLNDDAINIYIPQLESQGVIVDYNNKND